MTFFIKQVQVQALLATAVIGAVLLLGCGDGGKPSELVGRWVYLSGSDKTSNDDKGSMELFKDGTGIVNGEISITWKVENKRFVMRASEHGTAMDYNISGSILTFLDDDNGAKFINIKDGGKRPAELAGHWVLLSGAARNKPKNMELLADGTGVCDGENISWRVEAQLYVIAASRGIAADYNMSGDMLILTYGGEDSATFATKENFEKYAFDRRDGKIYKKAVIGGKTWMTQNLNYQTPKGSLCYDNDSSNCDKYGRLYDFKTAKSACPAGWHLPAAKEWGDLIKAAGGKSVTVETEMDPVIEWRGGAGKKLKSKSGWNENGNGTDDYGFSALPGGSSDSRFKSGSSGSWWWSDEPKFETWRHYQSIDTGDEMGEGYGEPSDGRSVRCVQNNN
jgi:uncharacterized protein (TIGR02145 family)